MLRAEAERSFSADLRIEPEIRSVVLHEPVGSLSMRYGNALIDDLNLVLCPVLQRYSAYTPYLDELDADWIRKKGPRFLIFDGQTIDGRHPWTETPAMWMETYRWYNTRVLATHHLLLERRREPRFSGFERLGNWRVRFGDELRFPKSEQPIFWSMHCSLNRRGKLGSELLLGNYLPADLAEFATVFGTDESHTFSVEKLQLGGPGRFVYQPDCELALFAPLR